MLLRCLVYCINEPVRTPFKAWHKRKHLRWDQDCCVSTFCETQSCHTVPVDTHPTTEPCVSTSASSFWLCTRRLPNIPLRRPSSAGRQRPNSAGGMGGTSGHGAGAGAGGTHGNAQGVRDRIKPASAGVKSAWDEAPKSLPRAPPHGLTSSKLAKAPVRRHTHCIQTASDGRCAVLCSHAHSSN